MPCRDEHRSDSLIKPGSLLLVHRTQRSAACVLSLALRVQNCHRSQANVTNTFGRTLRGTAFYLVIILIFHRQNRILIVLHVPTAYYASSRSNDFFLSSDDQTIIFLSRGGIAVVTAPVATLSSNPVPSIPTRRAAQRNQCSSTHSTHPGQLWPACLPGGRRGGATGRHPPSGSPHRRTVL